MFKGFLCSRMIKKEIELLNERKKSYYPPPVTRHLSPVARHPPFFTCQPRSITRHPLPVARHSPPTILHPPTSTLQPPPATLHPFPPFHPLTITRHLWKRTVAVVVSISINFFSLSAELTLHVTNYVMLSICSSDLRSLVMI